MGKKLLKTKAILLLSVVSLCFEKPNKHYGCVTSLYTYDGVASMTVFSGSCSCCPHFTLTGTDQVRLNGHATYADVTHLMPVFWK